MYFSFFGYFRFFPFSLFHFFSFHSDGYFSIFFFFSLGCHLSSAESSCHKLKDVSIRIYSLLFSSVCCLRFTECLRIRVCLFASKHVIKTPLKQFLASDFGHSSCAVWHDSRGDMHSSEVLLALIGLLRVLSVLLLP